MMGTNLASYQIMREIGRGGFAGVYKGVDTSSNRTVALKVLAPHLVWDKDFVSRFQREAQTVARLDHPNIVAIHNVGEADGNHYIAMDYLDGRTLKQLIDKEGALPLERAAHIIQQLASALDYAHQKGIVHRDVKPSNIIIGPHDHATLTDFGIVKATEGTRLTSTGVTLGTPEYMSPEQGQGLDVDRRSDIYSLGVVLYEMLTGKVPFSGTTPLAVLHKHVYEPPTALQALNPRLPQRLDRVVAKALAKDPNDRLSTAGDMAAAVLERERTAPTMRIPSVSERPRSRTKRRVARGFLISAAAVMILGAIGAGIIAQGRAVPTQTTATTIPLAIASTSTPTATSTRASTRIPTVALSVVATRTPIPIPKLITRTPTPTRAATNTPVLPTPTPSMKECTIGYAGLYFEYPSRFSLSVRARDQYHQAYLDHDEARIIITRRQVSNWSVDREYSPCNVLERSEASLAGQTGERIVIQHTDAGVRSVRYSVSIHYNGYEYGVWLFCPLSQLDQYRNDAETVMSSLDFRPVVQ
jgi:serine/threonine protein kinase